MSGEPVEGSQHVAGVDSVERTVAELGRRLAQLEAQLEALDASFVRHQGQNEDDFRRAEQSIDRVGNDLPHHLDAHWRSGR
jgi:hypothetical protein